MLSFLLSRKPHSFSLWTLNKHNVNEKYELKKLINESRFALERVISNNVYKVHQN
jgi:hypothetical protein